MVSVDLINRTSTVLEKHAGSPLYYVANLMQDRATVALTIMALIGIFISKDQAESKRMVSVSVMSILIPLVLFSLAKTKLPWYIVGIYPPLILLASVGVTGVMSLNKKFTFRAAVLAVPVVLILIALTSNLKQVLTIQPSIKETDIKRAHIMEGTDPNRIYNASEEKWQQSEVLLIEWNGSFNPINGKTTSWQTDAEGLLLIKNEDIGGLNTPFSYIYRGEQYSIVGHDKSFAP